MQVSKGLRNYFVRDNRYRVGAVTSYEAVTLLRSLVPDIDIQAVRRSRENDGPLIGYWQVYQEIYISGAYQRIPVRKTN
ncbi:MAG: hypothetical protein LUH07_03270 [Lachnospiraceae bacterium]|nr:hypothetical protein [Lachnospiraceae bacterium]